VRRLDAGIAFQVILMDGVGHYPQVERPAEFQGHLRRLIRSVVSGH
jgi:pimeloyl-ACP methyl ester carboxylesterase